MWCETLEHPGIINTHMFGFNGKEKLARMNNRSGGPARINNSLGGDDEPDDTNNENTQPELLNNYNYALSEEFDYLEDDKQQEQE